MSPDNTPDLTLIIPCFNEAGNVRAFFDRALAVFSEVKPGFSLELVFVDDGSSDGTIDELNAIVDGFDGWVPEHTCRIVVLQLSRNFGKESAIYAGLEHASGSHLCIIDADLQQDPQTALEMYEYLVAHDDCDVVAAYQSERNEGKVLGWLKRSFYRIFNATSDGIELPPDMSDFRVFTRQVADALLAMPETNRFSKGLFAWIGFNTHGVAYRANERNAGTSSWSKRKLFAYAFAGIASFSSWPLKMLKFIGGLFSAASLLYLAYIVIVDYLILGIDIPGYPTLVCLILLFGGFQLLAMGLIGDYLARTYIEGKNRPLYILRARKDSSSGKAKSEGD